MATGNHVIVVNDHSATKFRNMVMKLFSEYDEVVLSARGRHFARMAEVLRRVRPFTVIKDVSLRFADEAPELVVVLARRGVG